MARSVLAVLGGNPPDPQRLLALATDADIILAADSGAYACIEAGLKPVVIGDMDSFVPGNDLTVIFDPDQNTSDADKLFAYVKAEYPGANLVIAGLEGDRFDHVLASLSSLVQAELPAKLSLERTTGYLLFPGEKKTWKGEAGKTFSAIPQPSANVTIENAQWPLVEVSLTFGQRVSLSNIAFEDLAITVHSGCALVIFEEPIESA